LGLQSYHRLGIDANQSGYNFYPQHADYKTQLDHISQWVGMSHMQLEVVEVLLPSVCPNDMVSVTKFNFLSQLHSLLANKELNTASNLVINEADPFTWYAYPDGLLGECISGWEEITWKIVWSDIFGLCIDTLLLYISSDHHNFQSSDSLKVNL
jgi:hypothetical protein